MLHLGGLSKSVAQGTQQSAELISSGRALEKFRQMVELQGGDSRVIDDSQRLPQARQTENVTAAKSGFLSAMNCEQIGTACVILGGGRERKEDSVDPAVGIVLHKKVGDRVAVHFNSEARVQRARQLITDSCVIANAAPATKRPLIHRVIQRPGEKH
jgi:thymidine phosphorylase